MRGPANPVYVAGSRVQGYWPASFLSPIGGLNITLQSYVDRVDLGIVVCTDHVDDLDPLVTYLHEEVGEIVALARQHGAPSADEPTAQAQALGTVADAPAASRPPRKATTKKATTKKAATKTAATKRATTKKSTPRKRTAKKTTAQESATGSTPTRTMHVVKPEDAAS